MMFCALLAAGLLAACNRQETPPEATTTVEQVEEEPFRFYGQEVTLYGEVDEVHSERAFELKGMDVWWDDKILVLTRSPVVMGVETLTDDAEVLVTGTVRRMVAAEVERELGWDLEQEIEAEFVDQPVLIASSVRLYHEQARWTEQEYPQGTIVGLMSVFRASDPGQYVGQRIVISNAPVRSKTDQVLWIGYSDRNQILVAPAQAGALADLHEGEYVRITGILERMPSATEAQQMWNLPQAMQAQIAGEPIFIRAEQLEEIQQHGQPPQQEQQEQPQGEMGTEPQ